MATLGSPLAGNSRLQAGLPPSQKFLQAPQPPRKPWSIGKLEFFSKIDPLLTFEVGPMNGGMRSSAEGVGDHPVELKD